jgi:hypothetical protein
MRAVCEPTQPAFILNISTVAPHTEALAQPVLAQPVLAQPVLAQPV